MSTTRGLQPPLCVEGRGALHSLDTICWLALHKHSGFLCNACTQTRHRNTSALPLSSFGLTQLQTTFFPLSLFPFSDIVLVIPIFFIYLNDASLCPLCFSSFLLKYPLCFCPLCVFLKAVLEGCVLKRCPPPPPAGTNHV